VQCNWCGTSSSCAFCEYSALHATTFMLHSQHLENFRKKLESRDNEVLQYHRGLEFTHKQQIQQTVAQATLDITRELGDLKDREVGLSKMLFKSQQSILELQQALKEKEGELERQQASRARSRTTSTRRSSRRRNRALAPRSTTQ